MGQNADNDDSPCSGSEILELCKTMKKLVEDNRQKTELMGKMLDQNAMLIPKVGNNNNKISINVFLNERCKGAMNLDEFVDNVKVTLEDLNYTKDNGYVKGISNIFVKHLGGKSHSNKFSKKMEMQRNWHYLWSLFYFTKKHQL